MISIIIAARNEETHLEACIHSLLAQSIKDFEILIIEGMSEDKTADIAKKLCRQHTHIHFFSNPDKRAAEARNIGIHKAKGDYIGYIDAHTTAHPDWLEQLFNTLKKHNTWKGKPVGGVGSIHINPNNNKFTLAITEAFEHPLGGGGSSYKKGKEVRAVDTSYACLYTKKALKAVQRQDGSYYDSYFVKGQDADLNWRLHKAGFVLLQQPLAVTEYYKRSTWGDFWRQMYVAAFWRAKLTQRHPALFKPTLFAPLALYGGALLFLFLSVLSVLPWHSVIIYLAAYDLCVFIVTILTGSSQKMRVTLMVEMIHLAYALGLLKGFLFRTNTTKDRV